MAKKFLYTTYFNSNKPGHPSYGFSFHFTNDADILEPEDLQQTWFKWEGSWEEFDRYLKVSGQLLIDIFERKGISNRNFSTVLKEECKAFGKQLYDNQSLGNRNPLVITAYVYILKEIGGIPNDEYNGVSSIVVENDRVEVNAD